MRVTSFLCVMLMLTILWMQIYSSSREIFNGVSEYKTQIQHLKERSEHERLAIALEREQFVEFRQLVAAMMPEVLREKGKGEAGYPYRSLASILSRSDAENVRKTISRTLFDRGKEYFRGKEFAKGSRVFRQIIDKYGASPYVAESYFLLAESQFQESHLEECTSVISQMVELFPQHELTGFALVRLGRIYEIQNRNEEAVDIYKTVLRSFPQRDVAAQAKASLRGVEL